MNLTPEQQKAVHTITYLGMVKAVREYGNIGRDAMTPAQTNLYDQVDKLMERVLKHYEKKTPVAHPEMYDSVTEQFIEFCDKVEKAIERVALAGDKD